jgi:hypothetical protein
MCTNVQIHVHLCMYVHILVHIHVHMCMYILSLILSASQKCKKTDSAVFETMEAGALWCQVSPFISVPRMYLHSLYRRPISATFSEYILYVLRT